MSTPTYRKNSSGLYICHSKGVGMRCPEGIQKGLVRADTVPMFVRGVLSMQNMKYSKDYAAWMANAESLDALLEAKIHLSEIVPSGFSSDEDDDDDEEPTLETESSPEEVLQYAWETVCYVIWGKASAKGGQKVVEAAPEELRERYQEIFE